MNLPKDFSTSMRLLFGDADYIAFENALQYSPAVAFRPNIAKNVTAAEGLNSVPWSSRGYYLTDKPAFTFDPLFHAGAYYVQEPSSMFIEQALKCCAVKPCKVLDLCAAPGGKSTLIRSLLPDKALLVSNEPVKARAQVLMENMLKWGNSHCVVTNSYPKDFASLVGFFDIIAVDAPCSGEGMFRKDNPALESWSLSNVEMCAMRQREIVCDVWPALCEGGYMIYSTCTYNIKENEKNVEFFCKELGAEVVAVPTDRSWQITGNLAGSKFSVCRFLPHKIDGEGFFLALLRKTSSVKSSTTKNKKNKPFLYKSLSRTWQEKLKEKVDWQVFEKGDTTFAIHPDIADDVETLLNNNYVLSAGIPVCYKKGNKELPHHALAMSTQLRTDSFPRIEVEKNQALDYLRRMALIFSQEVFCGVNLLTYRNISLGFVNNIGARANNLYPQNWRIRSGYTANTPNDFLIVQ